MRGALYEGEGRSQQPKVLQGRGKEEDSARNCARAMRKRSGRGRLKQFLWLVRKGAKGYNSEGQGSQRKAKERQGETRLAGLRQW